MTETLGHLASILQRIDQEFWENYLKESSQRNKWIIDREWWHNKLYEYNYPNRGYEEQTVHKSIHREIPWSRDLFFPSPKGRFSLGNQPVAYFSQDFLVTCCEVIEQFRENEILQFSDIEAYLQGDIHLEGNWYGYPQAVRIDSEAVFADMTSEGNPLIHEIITTGSIESESNFFESTIRSWNLEKRRETQAISCMLRKKGFSGVVFKSVRSPSDVVLPEKNLVIFSPKLVIRNPYDPLNPKGFLWKGEEDSSAN